MTSVPDDREMSSTHRWVRPVLAVYWIALFIATHWPRLHIHVEGMEEIPIDKFIHFGTFFLLSILIFYASFAGPAGHFVTNLVIGSLIATTYAYFDEYSQTLVERVFDRGDLSANLLAVSCASLIVACNGRRRHTPTHENGISVPQPHSFIGHAWTVGSLTFASRILGLIRDGVIVAAFGIAGVSDAFYLAFKIPNLFRRLLGDGALSAAFIPIYTELRDHAPVTARRFAALTLALLMVVLGALTLLCEGILFGLEHACSWSNENGLAIRLAMVMLPYMPMICLAAVLGAMLQVHGRFGPAAFAPIVLNLCLIAAGWIALLAGDTPPEQRIHLLALSVLIAGLGQLILHVVPLLHLDPFMAGFGGSRAALKRLMVLMAPMLIGLGVFQINTLMDSVIAMTLSPKTGGPDHLSLFGLAIPFPIKHQGAVASLDLAHRLYQFPLGVFGIALATAIFPALARATSRTHSPTAEHVPDRAGDGEFEYILCKGLRLTVFIGLPATAGLILVRLPLVRAVFERGQVELQDSLRIAAILCGYASGVWAYCLTHVLTRAFYALNDARTPLRISVLMVGLNFILNLTLVWPLGAAGLAWSTAVCAAGQVILLLVSIRKHTNVPIGREVWRAWGKTLLLTGIMSAVLLPITLIYDTKTMSTSGSAFFLFVLVTAGVLIVGCGGLLLKVQELRWLLRRGHG